MGLFQRLKLFFYRKFKRKDKLKRKRMISRINKRKNYVRTVY